MPRSFLLKKYYPQNDMEDIQTAAGKLILSFYSKCVLFVYLTGVLVLYCSVPGDCKKMFHKNAFHVIKCSY